MTRDEAAKLLGFACTDAAHYEPISVRYLWAAQVRKHHPDTGESDVVAIGLLTQARDILLQPVTQRCTNCEGRGKVRARWGWVPCAPCKGTGDKP